MNTQDLHQEVLAVVLKAVANGMTAKELHSYFSNATQGMKINAAFNLKGADLLSALTGEVK